eukprot:Filipodium_phascolosomae@DN969_c0_g1_i2.p1
MTVQVVFQDLQAATLHSKTKPNILRNVPPVSRRRGDCGGASTSTSSITTPLSARVTLVCSCWSDERLHAVLAAQGGKESGGDPTNTGRYPNTTGGAESSRSTSRISESSGNCSSSDDCPKNSEGTLDIIVSSESMYREENYPLIVHILKTHLKRGGIAVLSGKRFYFGVGGGVASFHAYVDENAHYLKAEVVQKVEDGRSNVRDVLLIRRICK